ncbi:BRO1 domain-containing protein [Chloropicon primus]|uniref:BRO1 domain-containing protein n=1 Tax=Chloropicon primus TaxID=1764295 RepID=A0A5B8N0N7_9CHLO|nr:BRO1 domain-containing protein [Chloropicon primus]UPR04540.1 BRO1 domain-containing protein [Chloropicon primus]|eukprot:QDZ25334.1 BRO1 domain-containing protein [Chloropicon primus]
MTTMEVEKEVQERCLTCHAASRSGIPPCLGLAHEVAASSGATKKGILNFNTNNRPLSDEEKEKERERACELLTLSQDICNARSHAACLDKHVERQTEKAKDYCCMLSRVLEREEDDLLTCQFKWRTYITATNGSLDLTIKDVAQELRVALANYAQCVRLNALQEIDDSRSEEDLAVVCKSVVGELRVAAGALEAAGNVKTPKAKAYGIPSEACPSMARSMAKVCLGEAQLVTAHRASLMKLSRPTVSSLYFGAAQFYEEATKEIKGNIGEFNEVSEHQMKYLAFCSWLTTARAIAQMGTHCREQDQVGEAIATMEASRRFLLKCRPLAEDDSAWMEVFQRECERIIGSLSKLRKENEIVFFQTEAKAPVQYPEAKQVVSPLPLEL